MLDVYCPCEHPHQSGGSFLYVIASWIWLTIRLYLVTWTSVLTNVCKIVMFSWLLNIAWWLRMWESYLLLVLKCVGDSHWVWKNTESTHSSNACWRSCIIWSFHLWFMYMERRRTVGLGTKRWDLQAMDKEGNETVMAIWKVRYAFEGKCWSRYLEQD